MLHVAIATRAFRRYSTYTAATLAGIFTNCVFGVILCFVYTAVWDQRPNAGGYDVTDAITYAWLGQAMIMTVMIWVGGSPTDLAERIRSGDVAIDLYRPVGLLGWYLAADLGRAAYHLATRGLAPTLVGAWLFDLNWPDDVAAWLGFALSVVLAVLVSFGLRFLVACTAFWLLDATGPTQIAFVLAIFFSGMTVPLVIFPGLAQGRGARAAVGGVPPDPGGHLAGQALGPRPGEALGLQALGGRPARPRGSGAAPRDRKVVVQGG